MSDDFEIIKSKLKSILAEDLKEIRENKIRFAALVICLGAVLIFSFADFFDSDEEIDLNESKIVVDEEMKVDEKNIPAKNFYIASDEDIIPVIGANSDALFVRDPFKGAKKNKPVPTKKFLPPVTPPNIPPVANTNPNEKFILVGTAIGENKTALVKKFSSSSDKNSVGANLILSVGDTLQGKTVTDITAEFLQFADGSRLYIGSEQ